MKLSIGANLLQIMQSHQPASAKPRPKRPMRNFRCNLEEIDKIIEEDCGT